MLLSALAGIEYSRLLALISSGLASLPSCCKKIKKLKNLDQFLLVFYRLIVNGSRIALLPV